MVSGNKKTLTLKTLNKSNIWDVQENDVLRMWDAGAKASDFKDSADHYREIIKTAFDLEDVKVDRPEVLSKYEARGFKTASPTLPTRTSTTLPQPNCSKLLSATSAADGKVCHKAFRIL